MKKSSIVLLVLVAMLALVDFVEFEGNTFFEKVKKESQIRYVAIIAGTAYVLYSEYSNKKHEGLPTYEESMSISNSSASL